MDQLILVLASVATMPLTLGVILFGAAVANTVFPPVPIEAAMVFAGYLVSQGHASLPAIVVPVIAGMSLGGIAIFELARWCGVRYFEHGIFKRLMTPALHQRTSSVVKRYGVGALFAAKMIPGMYFCALVCVGVFRMGTGAAYAGIIASNVAAVAALTYLGYLAGEHWRSMFFRYGALAAGAAGLLLAGFIVVQWAQARAQKQL